MKAIFYDYWFRFNGEIDFPLPYAVHPHEYLTRYNHVLIGYTLPLVDPHELWVLWDRQPQHLLPLWQVASGNPNARVLCLEETLFFRKPAEPNRLTNPLAEFLEEPKYSHRAFNKQFKKREPDD
jgi:hypothetical protein